MAARAGCAAICRLTRSRCSPMCIPRAPHINMPASYNNDNKKTVNPPSHPSRAGHPHIRGVLCELMSYFGIHSLRECRMTRRMAAATMAAGLRPTFGGLSKCARPCSICGGGGSSNRHTAAVREQLRKKHDDSSSSGGACRIGNSKHQPCPSAAARLLYSAFTCSSA